MNRFITATVAAALLVGATACNSSDGPAASPTGSTSRTVQSSFPGLAAPTGEPELDGLTSASPAAGTVAWVKGPFDDRFTTRGLRFDGSAVRGALTITADVSDVLELQVLAGFFDADGRYLGEARFTQHLDESTHSDSGPPDESERFTIRVPKKYAGQARAAAIGVPVLVNE
jgi:hypothetical protein